MTAVYGAQIEKYRRLGLLKQEDGRVALTRRGISLSNTVMADFPAVSVREPISQ